MKISLMVPESQADIAGTADPESMEELAAIIASRAWSPSIYNQPRRNLKNWLGAQVIGLDIDRGCTLEEAKVTFAPYRHCIVTTRSHQKEKKNKEGVVLHPPCDRFRVVLQIDTTITNKAIFDATWQSIQAKFPFIDGACKDPSRLFYSGNTVVSFSEEGEYVKTVYPATQVKQLKASPPPADIDLENLEPGMEQAIRNAIKYLRQMPPSIEGENGSTALFNAARILIKAPFHFPRNVALYLIENIYNQEKCEPAWSTKEIEHKIDSVIKLPDLPKSKAKGIEDVVLPGAV